MKEERKFNGERTIFSINGDGITGYSHGKAKMNSETNLTIHMKITKNNSSPQFEMENYKTLRR